MTSWQKRVRFGVAVFGIVFAGFVYRSIGERTAPAPPRPIERLDPKASVETKETVLQQERGSEREFDIRWERSLTYDDKSARYFKVEITVRRPGGRVFVITAQEALAGPNQVQLQLVGEVELTTSDGFRLQTGRATFDRNRSIASVPGDLSFQKGLMSGSGHGATYDERSDVLQILEQARITTTDPAGRRTLDGSAGAATLDRLHDVLFLVGDVHVLRDSQTIDADEVMARLSSGEEVITYLELRGTAEVRGGDGSIESMRANAIDLDYSDDGLLLERAILNGDASVATRAEEHVSARGMSGEALDVHLAADGSVTSLTGRERVRLDLPGDGRSPVRSIRARTLDATGAPGRGLNAARFRGDVEFREAGRRDAPTREAHAQALTIALDGDDVSEAVFSGGLTFEERGLRASAPEARYQPQIGVLNLFGDAARVSDDHISVDASTIDLTLDSHGMRARGRVRTLLADRATVASTRDSGADGRLPGLLRKGEPTSINADALDYSGANGRAVYAGSATLVQKETAIRGDTITLDQQRGDLVASGSARSTLRLDNGRTEGRGDDIRYDDAARVVTYSVTPVAPTTRKGSAPTGAETTPTGVAKLAQLSGPDGDLRGERVEIFLRPDGNQVDRLEAHNSVTMVLGARTAVGARLTYHAREERYVMSGGGATPVTIRESCRETTGRTLTFFKSTDRIIVDGNDTRRTETRPCGPQPSR